MSPVKGKITFTKSEAAMIRKLIKQKLSASKNEQKGIRNQIRRIGFYFSDFSNKKGYTVSDFDQLIRSGKIIITDVKQKSSKSKDSNSRLKPKTTTPKTGGKDLGNKIDDLTKSSNFKNIINLNDRTLSATGLYCIRLKKKSKLPARYQKILDDRKYKFIYVGKAEGQSLRDRLDQELRHKRAGTFFRSIGCVLKYLPIAGHLKGKSNQTNYKFSKSDTVKIINWLMKNVEASIVPFEGDFSIEKDLIGKYSPLLNDTHNPLSLEKLKEDRAYCRKVARG